MATKLWTQPINKYTNWAGDESTNGLPVSGEQVQKYIKLTNDDTTKNKLLKIIALPFFTKKKMMLFLSKL